MVFVGCDVLDKSAEPKPTCNHWEPERLFVPSVFGTVSDLGNVLTINNK